MRWSLGLSFLSRGEVAEGMPPRYSQPNPIFNHLAGLGTALIRFGFLLFALKPEPVENIFVSLGPTRCWQSLGYLEDGSAPHPHVLYVASKLHIPTSVFNGSAAKHSNSLFT